MELEIENIKTFHIKFNRLDPIYIPGDEIQGHVYIDLAQQQFISGLEIIFLGRAVIKLPCATENQEQTLVQRNNDAQIRKKEVQQYFRTQFYLLQESEDCSYSLPEGMSEFPFVFVLPDNIPCSFEHEYGYIRYTVKANICIRYKIGVECKIAFTVYRIYDTKTTGFSGKSGIIFRNQCCTNCFTKPLKINFLIESIAFMPGVPVRVTLISNDIGKRIIIEMKLEQCINFIYIKSKNTVRTATQFIKLPITIENYARPELNNFTMVQIMLMIPSLPPSKLQYCRIIDLRYNFHIIVSTEGHDDVDISFPVEIGGFGFVGLTELQVMCLPQDGTNPVFKIGNIVLPKYIKMLNSCDAYIDDSGNFQYVLGTCSPSSACRITNIKEESDSKFIFGMEKNFSPIYPIYNCLNCILSI